jgi:hypothetical protein
MLLSHSATILDVKAAMQIGSALGEREREKRPIFRRLSFFPRGRIYHSAVFPRRFPGGLWGNVSIKKPLILLARSERFELPTLRFEV